MKLSIQVGSTSQSVNVFVRSSISSTGAGLTGLAFNTAGLTAYYALPKAASVLITLATLAAITTAYSSGGFKEVDATNMPGWYRFDIPDAALASGRFVSIHLQGAANMAPLPLEIELTGWNNQDATAGGISGVNTLLTRIPGTVQPQTGDAYARLGAPAGASVSADLAALPTANANADALLDRTSGIETGWTFRQGLRIFLAALAGKADGALTGTMHFRDQADLKNRITAAVDGNGNRSAVTLDAT